MDGMNQQPAASPAAGPSAITPGAQPGIDAQAMIKVRQAVMLLADSVGVLKGNLNGELGKAVLGALRMLAPVTPGVEEGLGQSELASMMQGLQGVRRAPQAQPNFLGNRPPSPMVMAGPPMGKPSMPMGLR